MKKLISSPEDLISHLIYGDIDEMTLDILAEKFDDYDKLNDEQRTRLAAAATVKAYFENKLCRGGYLKI